MPPKRKTGEDASAMSSKRRCPVDHTYRSGRKDGPTKCTWFPGTTEKSPHTTVPCKPDPKIMSNILEKIGNTPLVRINKLTNSEPFDIPCEILAKCEFFNAGGSVKDRIGKRMFEDAEASGRIKPGDTIIEPTSGNTGIGLALCAAVKGYRMIVTMPEKMSQEKVNVLKGLGAEIVRTPNSAAWDSPDSHIGVAKRLNKEIENSHILDQYGNPSNPLAHYDGTAEEILAQTDGKIDMLVVGAGTGGTLTGTARKIKEKCPKCIIIGVDPVGSILAEPDSLNDFKRLQGYQVEGTGYDFIPTVLDRELVDEWIKTSDSDSFAIARRMIREEGLLCGGSCGGSMWAALTAAKKYGLKAGQRVVVVLPDSVRNYMTKFLTDKWMMDHKFLAAPESEINSWWSEHTVASLQPPAPATVSQDVTCSQAITLLRDQGYDQLSVVDSTGSVLGVITEGNLAAQMLAGRITSTDSCGDAMYKQFVTVTMQTSLSNLARIFDSDHFCIVTTTQKRHSAAGVESKTIISGIVSRIDLINYISRKGSISPVNA